MLREEDIKSVLKKFPKFELCYEIMTHKKVHDANVILAIPEGKKYFAWFTIYKNENVCFLLEVSIKGNSNIECNGIIDVQIANTGFDDTLALGTGTIFYGTLFKNDNVSYFCTEDIYYNKGKSCINLTYLVKLEILRDIFKNEISQIPIIDKYTIFGLPLMNDNFNLLLKDIQVLPYKVNEIKFRYFGLKKINTMKYFKPNSQNQNNDITNISKSVSKAVFKIAADIEPDIYNLFVYKNGIEEYYDVACIPDYKTSVFMNGLFRNIKENINLDAIEESDDDEDFEDNREDKYVYLDRTINIACEYNNKFKKWHPISLAGKNDKIISSHLLRNY